MHVPHRNDAYSLSFLRSTIDVYLLNNIRRCKTETGTQRYANRRLVKNDSRLTRLLLRHRPYADSVRAIRRARTLVRPSSAVASGSTKLSRGRPCSSCSTKSLKLCFRVAAKELAADFDPLEFDGAGSSSPRHWNAALSKWPPLRASFSRRALCSAATRASSSLSRRKLSSDGATGRAPSSTSRRRRSSSIPPARST